METKARLIITEERLEATQGESFELGQGHGHDAASRILMDAATSRWRQGRDNEADLLRDMANQIKNAGGVISDKARARKLPAIYLREIPVDVPDSEGEESC